jgi:phosphotransferase system HPr-like phosphotransfer protein
MECKIKLPQINDVKEFVDTVSRFKGNVDVTSGRHCVDAKSIMGLFSLDLAGELTVNLEEQDVAEFNSKLKRFVV